MTVAKTIDVRISSVASRTTSALGRRSASGFAAFSRSRRTTFSTSMIASSTSAPMAIAMPPSVIVLMVDAERPQGEDRRRERQRHRRQRDGRRSQVREEQEDDDDDQQAAVAERLDDVVDRHLDEVGLPEDPAIDRHALRQLRLQGVELAIEPRGQLDRVRARLLLHADDDGRLAAAGSFAALQGAAFTHVGDVPDEDRAGAAQGHDAFADLLGVRARGRSPAARTPADLRCRSRPTCSGWRPGPRRAAR